MSGKMIVGLCQGGKTALQTLL